MRMSEKFRHSNNNNSDNPLTSRRTNGGKPRDKTSGANLCFSKIKLSVSHFLSRGVVEHVVLFI